MIYITVINFFFSYIMLKYQLFRKNIIINHFCSILLQNFLSNKYYLLALIFHF